MKRHLATIILALVSVLLLAACGQAAMTMEEAPAAEQSEAKAEAPRAAQRPTPQPAAKEAPAAKAERAPSTSSQQATKPAVQQPRTAGTTTFQDYPRATFVTTARDAVSTFSLDTDRTSFHLALNWAQSNYRVEPDSVRAEEWINAFNYSYAFPLREDSFAITSDVFDHPLDNDLHLARIAFQAADFAYDDTPVNVTLVLDASGSMSSGNRVAIAREAAESIRP